MKENIIPEKGFTVYEYLDHQFILQCGYSFILFLNHKANDHFRFIPDIKEAVYFSAKKYLMVQLKKRPLNIFVFCQFFLSR